MCLARIVVVAMCASTLPPSLFGQTVSVTGVVKEGAGAIEGARITALDGQGHVVGKLAISGHDGTYRTDITRAVVSMICQVLVGPKSPTYANNPARQPLKISSDKVVVDF